MLLKTRKNTKSLMLLAAMTAAILISPLTSHPASAQEASAAPAQENQVSMAEWMSLSKKERQLVVLASIEALFLAATQPDAPAESISTECLIQESPAGVEKKMRAIAKEIPNLPFTDVFLAITTCAAIPGQQEQ